MHPGFLVQTSTAWLSSKVVLCHALTYLPRYLKVTINRDVDFTPLTKFPTHSSVQIEDDPVNTSNMTKHRIHAMSTL